MVYDFKSEKTLYVSWDTYTIGKYTVQVEIADANSNYLSIEKE